jgi:SAM-dependent methyltransferase
VTTAIARWRTALEEWAIPQPILDAAPVSPWAHSPRAFATRADRALDTARPTPSARRAMEALPDGGVVLDVGCGAGAASLPLLTRAARLVAVDTDRGMLDELRKRVPDGCELIAVEGRWPDVAGDVPPVDVALCAHVAYNLPALDVAVTRMSETARRRVVVELTREHPRSLLNFLWPIFHGIERPARPTADDALAVVRECGFAPHAEEWTPGDLSLASSDVDELAAAVRRTLCVAAARDADIAHELEPRVLRRDGCVGLAPLAVRTLWWDVAGS